MHGLSLNGRHNKHNGEIPPCDDYSGVDGTRRRVALGARRIMSCQRVDVYRRETKRRVRNYTDISVLPVFVSRFSIFHDILRETIP